MLTEYYLKYKRDTIKPVDFQFPWHSLKKGQSDDGYFYSLKTAYLGQKYGFSESNFSTEKERDSAFASMWRVS